MKTEILVIGRNEEMLNTLSRLINANPEWNAHSASSDEEAIERFHSRPFDLILLSTGIEEASENKLRALFRFHDPDITILQHYGGGSGLLSNEINEAINNRKYLRWKTISVSEGI